MLARLAVVATLVLVAAVSAVYAADDYPKKAIRIVVPFPGGAGPDHVARLLGQYWQEVLGQTVVVENRTGALGSIGAAEVARAAPDGYTLIIGTNTTHASNVSMMKNLPYDPVKDFSPIIRTTTTAMVLLVRPNFPANNLAEFLAYGRAHPGLAAGFGSGAAQISVAQLQSRGKLSLIAATYRGVPLAMTDAMSGSIDLTFGDFSVSLPQMQAGTLKGLGVTSPTRSTLFPDLPALAEAMPGFQAEIWYGIFAPANTPQSIVEKLYRISNDFLSMPATRDKLAAVGVVTAPMKPDEFGVFVRSEIARWAADAKAANIEAK